MQKTASRKVSRALSVAVTSFVLGACATADESPRGDSLAAVVDTGLGAARDAGSERDARAADAGAGAATSLRARVCGAATTWPAPLPTAIDARTAARVGSARFGFVEGPVWIAERGELLFSDMDFSGGDTLGPPSRIRKLTPPEKLGVFVESSGSNGLGLLPDGTLIAATHDTRSLSLFDPSSGKRTDLTVRFEGKRFNSPNDLTVRSDGTVYFTDPDWQLGRRPAEIGRMGVYRVGPLLRAGQTLAATLVEGTLDKPNGVALSPDERVLYIGSSGDEIWRYEVAADGSVGGRRMFARVGGSDGMTVDCAGNLYVASQTVEVFAPSGERLGEIRTAESPSNVAFGGADRKTLYITAQSGLYAIALGVPGYPY